MVERDDQMPDERKAATEYAAALQQVLPHRRIALLHGRMKPKEKERVMGDFAAGAFDILVSTTVVEVGMDVPNASVMVVENAEPGSASASSTSSGAGWAGGPTGPTAS